MELSLLWWAIPDGRLCWSVGRKGCVVACYFQRCRRESESKNSSSRFFRRENSNLPPWHSASHAFKRDGERNSNGGSSARCAGQDRRHRITDAKTALLQCRLQRRPNFTASSLQRLFADCPSDVLLAMSVLDVNNLFLESLEVDKKSVPVSC